MAVSEGRQLPLAVMSLRFELLLVVEFIILGHKPAVLIELIVNLPVISRPTIACMSGASSGMIAFTVVRVLDIIWDDAHVVLEGRGLA